MPKKCKTLYAWAVKRKTTRTIDYIYLTEGEAIERALTLLDVKVVRVKITEVKK